MPKPPKNIKPLLRYFVNLFKLQVTGENNPSDAVRIIPVVEKATGESIYEFKMRYRSAWKVRRMSIESLGETVESKSTCYKVVYDDLLVIKIPPRPIKDFDDYLTHIKREHANARLIQNIIPCVYPKLGAILNKVPTIRLASYISEEDSEAEYISLLSKYNGLQSFLKIGNGFVFFMTLSKYRFFNQIIHSIHHAVDHARQEILKNGPQAISDFIVFESLYGTRHDRTYFDMQALMKTHDRSIEIILQEAGVPGTVPDFQKQEWLFSSIAGISPEINHDNIPKEVFDRIEEMTKQLVESKKPLIGEFRKIVHKASKNKNFSNNRARIKGLIINLLELLYRLKKQNAAIRDLKPDNMYIAAFLDGADHILADPSAYKIGLIDLETALCFKPKKDGRIDQPLLAGTPSYATPSHIFGNKILRTIYTDQLPRIFYMQDMQATLVMIFKVITGRIIFVKTARLMPEISHIKRKNAQDFQSLLSVYKNVSHTFWKTAIDEYKAQTLKYRHRLVNVEIELPGHLKKFLAEEYQHEFDYMGFTNNERKQKDYHTTLAAIKSPVSGEFLLAFMFNRVFGAMYLPDWGGKTDRLKGIKPFNDSNL